MGFAVRFKKRLDGDYRFCDGRDGFSIYSKSQKRRVSAQIVLLPALPPHIEVPLALKKSLDFFEY
jgi:hypothetical protein